MKTEKVLNRIYIIIYIHYLNVGFELNVELLKVELLNSCNKLKDKAQISCF